VSSKVEPFFDQSRGQDGQTKNGRFPAKKQNAGMAVAVNRKAHYGRVSNKHREKAGLFFQHKQKVKNYDRNI